MLPRRGAIRWACFASLAAALIEASRTPSILADGKTAAGLTGNIQSARRIAEELLRDAPQSNSIPSYAGAAQQQQHPVTPPNKGKGAAGAASGMPGAGASNNATNRQAG